LYQINFHFLIYKMINTQLDQLGQSDQLDQLDQLDKSASSEESTDSDVDTTCEDDLKNKNKMLSS